MSDHETPITEAAQNEIDWVDRKGAFGIPGEVIMLESDLDAAIEIIGSSVPYESLIDGEIDWPDHLPRLPNLVKFAELDESLVETLVERIPSATRNSRFGVDSVDCGCVAQEETPHVHPADETPPSSEHPIEAEPVKSQPVKSQPVKSQTDKHMATLAEPLDESVKADNCTDNSALVIILDNDPLGDPFANGVDSFYPTAGHAMFIEGLIKQRAPGVRIEHEPVIDTNGETTEWIVLCGLVQALFKHTTAANIDKTIFGMSFSGQLVDFQDSHFRSFLELIGNVVFVASAGNYSSPIPLYPAAFGAPTGTVQPNVDQLENVVGVGALGPCGPAQFTNYGCWVRACAPGADLVSNFYSQTNPESGIQFAGWATWSGTSFSAPVVIAELVREMRVIESTGLEAVKSRVDAKYLARWPGLGTIINL